MSRDIRKLFQKNVRGKLSEQEKGEFLRRRTKNVKQKQGKFCAEHGKTASKGRINAQKRE